MSAQEPLEQKKTEHVKRDVETFKIIGGFLTYLACVVLVAAFMEVPGKARIVNFGASMTLLAIGLGMFFYGRFLRKRVR